eukprot:CAMPEP_0118660720 /NCGR_PEP_ID=MMETSP0785-20121206/15850_1 /TAXON_ID=91992 /ORGANISM="Bolidomonas pacifica, Strain CCMP 1866" /LENGTH=197 /DNA_ID=CAMNT_0006554019 /DNA_START=112 /DNA_END=702 /DNA_ORIENTATION=+
MSFYGEDLLPALHVLTGLLPPHKPVESTLHHSLKINISLPRSSMLMTTPEFSTLTTIHQSIVELKKSLLDIILSTTARKSVAKTSAPSIIGFINETTTQVNNILNSIPSPPTSDSEAVNGEVCKIILSDIKCIGEVFDMICKLDAAVNRSKVGVRYVGEKSGNSKGARRRRLRNFVLGDDLRILVEEGVERTEEELV